MCLRVCLRLLTLAVDRGASMHNITCSDMQTYMSLYLYYLYVYSESILVKWSIAVSWAKRFQTQNSFFMSSFHTRRKHGVFAAFCLAITNSTFPWTVRPLTYVMISCGRNRLSFSFWRLFSQEDAFQNSCRLRLSTLYLQHLQEKDFVTSFKKECSIHSTNGSMGLLYLPTFFHTLP